jgi:hypothetical protein
MRLVAGEATDNADAYQLREENKSLKAKLEALSQRGDFIKS